MNMKPRLYRGYDNVADIKRANPSQNYFFGFDKPTKTVNLNTASIEAAKEFYEKWSHKEIVILYSGGLDSEWLCESFYLANVPFTPLIINYNDANDHDLYWAKRYLERRNITNFIEWKFDFRNWYGSEEQFEIAKNAQMAELAYSGQFKAILEHNTGNRVFLTGYDEPVITADDSGASREWNLVYNERHYSIHKLLAYYNVPSELGGWVDANVFSAYVRSPMWQWLVANLQNNRGWNSELFKTKIYITAFPFMEFRPKYTGFEKMTEVVVPATQKWRKHCMEQYGTIWLQDWSMNIKDVWKDLGVYGNM